MIKYHPDTRFLTDFAAGSLPKSQALCVAAHVHYCAECKNKIAALTAIGAELFDTLEPQKLSDMSFDKLALRLKSEGELSSIKKESAGVATAQASARSELPPAIHNLTKGNLANLNWSGIGKSFSLSRLNTGDVKRETTLFDIKAGCHVPKHHHKGDEITVVLKGSFSDVDDHYNQGDFIVRTAGEAHSPVASQNGDCLCLSTLDAPIVLNNWVYRLLLPLYERIFMKGNRSPWGLI